MAELNSESTEVVNSTHQSGDRFVALREGGASPDGLVKLDQVPWTVVSGKPSTFAPSAHSHAIADVTGLQTALDGKQAAGSYATGAQGALAATALQPGAQIPWTDVTGKPSTFTPAAHSHAIADTTGLQTALDGKAATSHTHDPATTGAAGFMSAADKTKLDGVAAGANNYSHPNHSGDVTSAGDGATTISNDAVTNAKLANMATARIKGRATAGTGDPEDLTAAEATSLLDTFTTSLKGLAPASGGGTTNFLRADGSWAAPAGGGGSGAGRQTIFIPAAAMVARITNGPSDGIGETTTNRVMRRTLDFDATTAEFAQFAIAMPKSWNEGTITFQPLWSHAATTTNFGVVWTLAAVAHSDADALEAAFGTAISVTDTGGTTDTLYIGPESSAVTIAGTPAEMDQIVLQIGRLPTDGSDTMAIDARLHGVRVYYTATTGVDD